MSIDDGGMRLMAPPFVLTAHCTQGGRIKSMFQGLRWLPYVLDSLSIGKAGKLERARLQLRLRWHLTRIKLAARRRPSLGHELDEQARQTGLDQNQREDSTCPFMQAAVAQVLESRAR